MRHLKKSNKLSRTRSGRKALMKAQAAQLFKYGMIKTTVTKAKILREIAEPLVTRAKKGTIHDRRYVASFIGDKKIVKKLFSELAPLYSGRNGGYTRVLRLNNRGGDNAEMALIEMVDREKVYKKEEKKEKGKKAKKEGDEKQEETEKKTKKEKKDKTEKKEKKEMKKEEKKEEKKEQGKKKEDKGKK